MELLELKDKDFSYSRPNMICNFLYAKEEEPAESQDKVADESEEEARDKENADQKMEVENIQSTIERDDSFAPLDTTGAEAV